MTTGESSNRHREALRLFEAGLKAFYEAAGTATPPSWAEERRAVASRDRLLEPRPSPAPPPSAPAPGAG